MKLLRKIPIVLTLSFLFSHSGYANNCPKIDDNTPLCPDSGSTMLNETYPAKAFVVSTRATTGKHFDNLAYLETPAAFIENVMDSYNFSNKTPQIIVPTNKEDFEELKLMLADNLKKKGLGKLERQAVLGKVVHAPSSIYTWQQDYFEAFTDLKTGQPVVRGIESYSRTPSGGVDAISEAGKKCNIKSGKGIEESYESTSQNAEMGGNIEGLPGGLCLVGKNQGSDFTEQFCDKKENIVQIETGWLTVGHVDEIVKVIPAKFNDGRPKECNFSVNFASPDKAMELLEKAGKNDSVVDGPSYGLDRRSKSYYESMAGGSGGRYLCQFSEGVKEPEGWKFRNMDTGVRGVFLLETIIEIAFFPSAHAGLSISSDKAKKASEAYTEEDLDDLMDEEPRMSCDERLSVMTNNELVSGMKKDQQFLQFNKLVQKSMDDSKKIIKKKLIEKLPQCAKYLDFVDVPDLFYSRYGVNESMTGPELTIPGNGGSVFPNPTNSVLANNSMLISDPKSKVFKDYMDGMLKKRGIKSKYINTWEYAHLGDGNMHCSSHTIRFCKPRSK